MDNEYPSLDEERGGKSALAVVVIIIVLLLVGGVYAINSQNKNKAGETATTTEATLEDTLGSSTNLSDIDADLSGIDAAAADADLNSLGDEAKGL
jgi:hypothetical protein